MAEKCMVHYSGMSKLTHFLKHPTSYRAVKALVVVVFFSAVTHISLIILVAIFRGEPNIASPVDFLGIATIFPEAKKSGGLNLAGWLLLLIAFLILLRHFRQPSKKKAPGAKKDEVDLADKYDASMNISVKRKTQA